MVHDVDDAVVNLVVSTDDACQAVDENLTLAFVVGDEANLYGTVLHAQQRGGIPYEVRREELLGVVAYRTAVDHLLHVFS